MQQQQIRTILQGEMADLALYRALRSKARGGFAELLNELIATEERHVAFWRSHLMEGFVDVSLSGRFRNGLIRSAVAVFGVGVGYVCLEAVESNGIQYYLQLWNRVQDEEVRAGIREILQDELQHEDAAITGGERFLAPDTIRNAFLGFNDGSVEILGAVSGLVAALSHPDLVAIAAGTVSVAGAVSMAAGAFVSTDAERELEQVAAAKDAFLSETHEPPSFPGPWKAAGIVGTGYLVGAFVPVAPFFFGATHAVWSIGLSGTLILVVSALLAFLSGMSLRRRVLLNAGVVAVAVVISYVIGLGLDRLVGTVL